MSLLIDKKEEDGAYARLLEVLRVRNKFTPAKYEEAIIRRIFSEGVDFAINELTFVIERRQQNIAESVSIAVGAAEQEQDEKYIERLQLLTADYHKNGRHEQGHVVEYITDYLFR